MRKIDIDKVIKGGSVRQKIKLYMTDIALANIDWTNQQKELLLSDKQRDELWRSIKDPKDIKYYNDLRNANRGFLLFKPQITICKFQISLNSSNWTNIAMDGWNNEYNTGIINSLLDLYETDKAREKATKIVSRYLDATRGKEKEIIISSEEKYQKAREWAHKVNERAKYAKELISFLKVILSKDLPLQPYINWLKKEESDIINILQKSNKASTLIPNGGNILRYEDIIIDAITEDDLSEFKNVGL